MIIPPWEQHSCIIIRGSRERVKLDEGANTFHLDLHIRWVVFYCEKTIPLENHFANVLRMQIVLLLLLSTRALTNAIH